MGNGIGAFSSNPLLAGGANVLTWIIGLYTLARAIQFIIAFLKTTFANGVSNVLKTTRRVWGVHLSMASADQIYLQAFNGSFGSIILMGIIGAVLSGVNMFAMTSKNIAPTLGNYILLIGFIAFFIASSCFFLIFIPILSFTNLNVLRQRVNQIHR